MTVCNQATAANMCDAIDQKMKIYDISWTKCIGYGGDNASMMMGCRSSFLTRVKVLSPSVHAVGCPCHLTHLCASKGAAKLSVNVERIVIDSYYHFDKSSTRKEVMKEYRQFCDVEEQKILKHCFTRWLSLSKSLTRCLKQYDAPRSYSVSRDQVPEAV